MSKRQVKKIRKIDIQLERVHRVVMKAKKEGKKHIDYIEIAVKLEISPTYARELLKLYARIHGLTYSWGRLLL